MSTPAEIQPPQKSDTPSISGEMTWADRFLGLFLEIQPGEGIKALSMFFYFFLVIFTYYLIKPATRALMMESVGGAQMPLGNFSTALIIGFVVVGYDFLAGRLRRQYLISAVTGFAIFTLLGVWGGFSLCSNFSSAETAPQQIFGVSLVFFRKALALVFFVFADVYSVMGTTMFWSLSHDLFSSSEGKRFYGFIGGGGALGGIFGGLIAGWLVSHIGVANLILLAILPLLCTIFLAFFIVRQIEKEKKEIPDSSSAKTKKGGGIEGLKLICGSSYLQLITALVGIVLMGSLIIETQFNMTIEKAFSDTNERASFMGYRDSQLTFIQFLSQTLLTAWLIRKLGMAGVLLIMPIGDLLMGALFFFSPTLAVANWAKIFDGTLKYGTNQVTKEILYLPTSASVKYQAKAFIDVFFHRIAKGLSAALLLFLTQILGSSEIGLFYPLTIFCVVWVVIIYYLCELYKVQMEQHPKQN